MFLSDEGPTLRTLDFTIRIGSTPTVLYFHLYIMFILLLFLSIGNNFINLFVSKMVIFTTVIFTTAVLVL